MSGVELELPRDFGAVTEAWLDTEAMQGVAHLDNRIIELTALQQQKRVLEGIRLGGQVPEYDGHIALNDATKQLHDTMRKKWPWDFKEETAAGTIDYVRAAYADTVTLAPEEIAARTRAAKGTLASWRLNRDDDDSAALAARLSWSLATPKEQVVGRLVEDDEKPSDDEANESLGVPIVLDAPTVHAREVERGTLITLKALREELNAGGNEVALLGQTYKWLDLTNATATQIAVVKDKIQIARIEHACAPQLGSISTQLRAIDGLVRAHRGVRVPSGDHNSVEFVQTNLAMINNLRQRIQETIAKAPDVDLKELATVGFGLYGNESSLRSIRELNFGVLLNSTLNAADLRHVTGSMVGRLQNMAEILEKPSDDEFIRNIMLGALRHIKARQK